MSRSSLSLLAYAGLLALIAGQQVAARGALTCGIEPAVRCPYFPTGALTIADMNGDGFGDLVRPGVVALNDGTGAFSCDFVDAVTPGSFDPSFFAVDDLDGDGDLDIAHSGFGLSVGINDGTGVISLETIAPADGPMTLGDFDGVAGPDIAVVDGTVIRVLLNDGAGGFSASAAPVDTVSTAFHIASGDVDDDGDDDLVTSSTFASGLMVFRRTVTGFAPPISYPLGTNPGSLVVVDVNGDDAVDIVTGSGRIRFNDGNGVFNAPGEYVGGGQFAVGDIDGDGDVDVTYALYGGSDPGGFAVTRNLGNGVFGAPEEYTGVNSPRSVTLGDIDDDGDLDLAITDENDVSLFAFRNDGAGVYSAPYRAGSNSNASGIAAGDLDGDQTVDLVFCSGSVLTTHLGIDHGAFASPLTTNTNTFAHHVEVAYINNDALLDVVIASPSTGTGIGVLFGAGDGTFSSETTYPLTGQGLLVGDLDGDGDADIARAGFLGVSVLLNDGAGGFTGVEDTTRVPGRAGNKAVAVNGGAPTASSGSLSFADVNGDGHLDIAVSNIAAVRFWLGAGDGTFPTSSIHIAESVALIGLGDLDGDTAPDLAWARPGGPLNVCINDGTGTFSDPVEYAGTTSGRLLISDVNGDAHPDVVTMPFTSFTGGGVFVHRNLGTGAFAEREELFLGTFSIDMRFADLNQDLTPDLIVTDSFGGGAMVWMSRCATGTCPSDLDASGDVGFADLLMIISQWGPCPPGPCAADLNENGAVDLADGLIVLGSWGPCS